MRTIPKDTATDDGTPNMGFIGWVGRLLTGRPHFSIGGTQRPYLLRWYLLPRNRWMNLYLHKFCRDDDDRALHDHPWWFVSMMVAGRYREYVPGGGAKDQRSRGAEGGRGDLRTGEWHGRETGHNGGGGAEGTDGGAEDQRSRGAEGGRGDLRSGGWSGQETGHNGEWVCEMRRAGSIAFRRAEHRHRVELLKREDGTPIPCWTLILTGPNVRTWGFWCPKGFVPWHEFVSMDDTGDVGPGCGA